MTIESLTPEQEAKLSTYRDEGIRVGLGTGPVEDKARVEYLFTDLYQRSGLTIPDGGLEFHYVRSPLEGNRLVSELTGESGFHGNNAGYGSQDMHWLSFYKFFQEECGMDLDPRLNILLELAGLVGWYWPYEDRVIVCDRPAEIHMRSARLHRDGGPAIRYEDGLEVYALNGVIFRDDMTRFITTPASELDAKEVLNIRNAEQRAEIIKKMGVSTLFHELNPKKLDTDGEYELYSVPVYEDSPRIYLKMQNPSVDEIHIEAVHPDCKTVQEALQWRNFGTVGELFNAPAILT